MVTGADIDSELARITCGLTEAALIGAGVDPITAAAIGERACRPLAEKGFRKARKDTVKKAKKTVKNVKKSKAMKAAQSKARTKSGAFKKNWNKSRLMKEYHRIYKRLK